MSGCNITQEELKTVVEQLRSIGFAKFGPWTFAFTPKGKEGGGGFLPINLFTARVHTSTVAADWGTMGAVCKAIGVPGPDKCTWPKTIETDADATHRWIW